MRHSLRELDRRALEVAAVLLELRLEAVDEGERVGRGAGEAGQHLAVVQAPDLLRPVLLDHGLAEGDLAVAGERAVPPWRTARMVVPWRWARWRMGGLPGQGERLV